MKSVSKAVKLLGVSVMCMALVSCSSANVAEQSEPADAGKVYNIGIVQPVEHNALDEARQGFIDALADEGFKEPDVIFSAENAQGDISNLSTICDRFVSQEVDLVLAIATDSAQAMASKTTEIPIIATAVTSFEVAGLVESDENPGGNVTGSSDMNPVAEQIQFISDLVTDVKTIGLIYNNSEDNSLLQADIAKEAITEQGLEWTEVTVVNSSDIQQAMQSIITKCDAIYIPTDNTLASAMATVHSSAVETKTPVFCGEANMVMAGGLATMGINYYDLGRQAGEMAAEVLNGADPAKMPVRYAASSDNIIINGAVAEEIGFEVPDEFAEYIVMP